MPRVPRAAVGLLALLILGGVAWWSLSGPREPTASAELVTRASEPVRSSAQQEPVTPAASTAVAPPPREEPLAPEPTPLRVAALPPAPVVAPPWSAPLDVVVLDSRTGEGVPFVRVRAHMGLHSAWEQVDGAGLARFSQTFGAGNLELTLRDEFSNLRLETTTLRSPPAGEEPAPVEWPIDIGPTYGLQLDARSLPGGEHSIVAMLCETGPGGEIRCWSTRELADEEEGQRWLRYKEVEHEPVRAWEPVLRVWARGTFYSGEVSVPATVGLHEHLSIELHASAGGLRGSVTDPDGLPVPEAHVIVMGGRAQFLGPDEDGSEIDSKWLDLETDKEGRFEAPAVSAGTYQVVVCSRRRPFERSEVTIVTGAVTECSFVLGPQVSEVDTQGEVVDAATGDPVAGAGALVLVGSKWFTWTPSAEAESMFASMGFDWNWADREFVVGAQGYVPVRLRAWDCVQVGNTREYRVRLRRGHGAALVVVGADKSTPFGRPLPGARVFVDDLEVVADSSGLALIEANAPIETITCEAPGWLLQGLTGFAPPAQGLGFFVHMARE